MLAAQFIRRGTSDRVPKSVFYQRVAEQRFFVSSEVTQIFATGKFISRGTSDKSLVCFES